MVLAASKIGSFTTDDEWPAADDWSCPRPRTSRGRRPLVAGDRRSRTTPTTIGTARGNRYLSRHIVNFYIDVIYKPIYRGFRYFNTIHGRHLMNNSM